MKLTPPPEPGCYYSPGPHLPGTRLASTGTRLSALGVAGKTGW